MKATNTWSLNEIINNDSCSKCEICSIVCPNNLIDFNTYPELNLECLRKGNGMCKEVCPRTTTAGYQIKIRAKLENEKYYKTETNTLKEFIITLIKEKEIDGAIIIGGEKWEPKTLIHKEKEEIKETYYKNTKDSIKESVRLNLENIAIIGLPCQIAGLRKLEYFKYISKHDWERGTNGEKVKLPKIKYHIGLFCKIKLDYQVENQINTKNIISYKKDKNNLIIKTKTKEETIKLEKPKINKGCLICKDYKNKLADLSIGKVKENLILITRNEKGEKLKKYLKTKKIEKPEEIEKLETYKKERLEKTIKEKEKYNYYTNGDYGGVGNGQNGYNFIRLKSTPSGYYKTEDIKQILEITEKYNGIIKLTNRMEFEIQEIKPKDVENLEKDLEKTIFKSGGEGPLVRSTMSCPGEKHCQLGLIDTTKLDEKIEEKYAERPTTYKFKIAISGCPNKCVRPSITEFGINGVEFPKTNKNCNGCGRCQDVCKLEAIEIRGNTSITNKDQCIGCGKCIKACPNKGKEIKYKGYSVYIGGKSGREIVEGNQLYLKTEEELLNLLENILKLYDKYGEKPQKERLADTIKRIGEVSFLNELNQMSK